MHVTNRSRKKLLPAFLFCLLAGGTFSAAAAIQLNQYDKIETVDGITSNPEVEAQLKKLLGNEYNDFLLNFDLNGEPHYTAAGGLFVNGLMQHLAQENASAFVIYPDGKLYAAWILPGEKIIHYRTNTQDKNIHSDIQQWANDLEGRTFEASPTLAENLFSGKWLGDDNTDSTFDLQLTQQGNKITGSYCFITQGGNRIDCADKDQNNIQGEVNNNIANITFDSTFGGVNGKAVLVVEGEKMKWRLTQPPVKGDYYAPEHYNLMKDRANTGAATRIMSTNKFTISIRNNCGLFNTPCDDMLYTGARNSDNSMISLKGKTVQDSQNHVIGAEFTNGNVIYLVNYQPAALIVKQGEKILISQPAHWLE